MTSSTFSHPKPRWMHIARVLLKGEGRHHNHHHRHHYRRHHRHHRHQRHHDIIIDAHCQSGVEINGGE